MIENMTGILVLIASPGDTAEERATVRDKINDWNTNRGPRQKIVFLPWLFERHAVSRMGDRPQAIINSQAVDKADAVIAFFRQSTRDLYWSKRFRDCGRNYSSKRIGKTRSPLFFD